MKISLFIRKYCRARSIYPTLTDSNLSVSKEDVSVKAIKICAYGIALLHLLVLPLFYVFAEIDDAPGVIGVGLVVPFASIVIALFTAVLQKLLQEAVEIKCKNDLKN